MSIDLAGFSIEGRGDAIVSSDRATVSVRNGFISVSGGAAVRLDGEGSIVEGVQAGGGIIANGIVRNNTVFGDGTDADIGISATGVITGNYVSSIRNGDGIVSAEKVYLDVQDLI
ncbi:MAG: hypothetical protein JO358_23330 [Alphaproteobacteria bacterium]|nr:hypothetical protein [Alphaproteobacteria bacterium]